MGTTDGRAEDAPRYCGRGGRGRHFCVWVCWPGYLPASVVISRALAGGGAALVVLPTVWSRPWCACGFAALVLQHD